LFERSINSRGAPILHGGFCGDIKEDDYSRLKSHVKKRK